jgi:hypothetical protein
VRAYNTFAMSFHIIFDVCHITDPFNGHHDMFQSFSPIFGQGPAARSNDNKPKSTSNTPTNGSSRIIPIQIERPPSVNNNNNNQQKQILDPVEQEVPLNTLGDLRSHQMSRNAEESIRGYTRPNVISVQALCA